MRLPGGLTFKLVAAILGGCLLIYAVILRDSHRRAHDILLGKIEREAHALGDMTAERLKTILISAETVPTHLADFLSRNTPDRKALDEILQAAISSNTAVYGSTIAFEPYAFDPNVESFSPYWYRKDGRLRGADLADPSYAYREKDWYRVPREKGRAVWSEPYVDVGGGEVLMTTYAVPIFRETPEGRRLLGVATADISLDWLQDLVGSIRVERSGYAFLLGVGGEIVAGKHLARGAKMADLASRPGSRGLDEVAARMSAGGSGLASATDPAGDRPVLLAFAPLGLAGSSLGLVFPEREVMEEADALGRRMAILGGGGAVALALVVTLVAGTITKPLRRLTGAANEVAAGRLDAEVPLTRSRDEVGELTSDFRKMQQSLLRYVEEQRRSAAAVARLESELRIAREIQMSFVPKDLDRAPETLGCDAFGILDPAREVGGDLFDMFRGQDGDVRFLIGDVSDKGIPAALFMAMTHTLLKGAARELREPSAVLERVNADLAGRTGATMFVTLLCGSFDAASGLVKIALGGHTPAVIVPREGPPRLLGVRPGTVVGVVQGIEIPIAEDRLEPGDTLVLYTDGVTEAMDPQGNLFGEERLLASLAGARAADARGTAERTLAAVRAFSNGAPQSDDIAILAIRRLRHDA